jgi:hypothetical protein
MPAWRLGRLSVGFSRAKARCRERRDASGRQRIPDPFESHFCKVLDVCCRKFRHAVMKQRSCQPHVEDLRNTNPDFAANSQTSSITGAESINRHA